MGAGGLRAHGHSPEYASNRARDLTPANRAQLKAINLHFHDLRREAASRWLDGGVPLHTIRAWIGHANISQTSTYLESTFADQHDAMRAFDERQGRLQTFASKVETGHPLDPISGTDPNGNTPEMTQKPH